MAPPAFPWPLLGRLSPSGLRMPPPFIKSGRSPRAWLALAIYNSVVTVRAVIFDWGGTLTPWHTFDQEELWRAVCTQHFPDRADALAAALRAAETEPVSYTHLRAHETRHDLV